MHTWTYSQPIPRARLVFVTRNPVADSTYFAEFLDVQVQQLAGMLFLVSANWLWRCQLL